MLHSDRKFNHINNCEHFIQCILINNGGKNKGLKQGSSTFLCSRPRIILGHLRF